MSQTIDHLIINGPYDKPKKYWLYDRETRLFKLVDGRRPSGYLEASNKRGFDDPGVFQEIPLVNKIRKRVEEWVINGYPGVTGVTRKLLDYWSDRVRRDSKFFFCQLEAIQTLIFLKEAHESDRQGIEIPSDGGSFTRVCSKMATGTGKTIVMGMLITWHVLNKVAHPTDNRFSKNFLIIAPGLTVKKRLEVLYPYVHDNVYLQFDIVPQASYDMLRQAFIVIHNWHVLMPVLDKKKNVVKKGTESDEVYARRVLGKKDLIRNLIVINDEAHHAWRTKAGENVSVSLEELEEATMWIGGLDKINKAKGIAMCYDFSATPFIPSGRGVSNETLYEWIVSDFSLNDAIESGLVKTPRVAYRDDGLFREDHSRFRHIYMDPEVKANLNRRTKPEESLPDLVRNAYYVLGKDWLETKNHWEISGAQIPPVMITVCNRTETAARIEFSFKNKKLDIEQLGEQGRMLHIDSKVLSEAEGKQEYEIRKNLSNTSLPIRGNGDWLREVVTTVGKIGKPGQYIHNIIAVQMLSEGWDAVNVTHIMGLRAFTSQLLCEQVVGRGLRRTSYQVNPQNGLFEAEYVNIFGIPFTFLPAEGDSNTVPAPPKPVTCIEPYPSKKEYEITWPNIIRIERTISPELLLDWNKVRPVTIRPEETSLIVELAPIIDGKPHVDKVSIINIEELGKRFRLQSSSFNIARDVYENFKPDWKGNKEYLLFKIVKVVDQFIHSDKLRIPNTLFGEELRRRVLIALNMDKIVHHIWSAITFQNVSKVSLVFDKEKPLRSTMDMMPWYTTRVAEYARRSHISHAVMDSNFERATVFELETNPNVKSWVKNDHLGFDVAYVYQGIVHKYWPDFLIKLRNNLMVILEIKGQDTEKDRTKREYLDQWVKGVNEDGRFGEWNWDVAFNQSDVKGIISKIMKVRSMFKSNIENSGSKGS